MVCLGQIFGALRSLNEYGRQQRSEVGSFDNGCFEAAGRGNLEWLYCESSLLYIAPNKFG